MIWREGVDLLFEVTRRILTNSLDSRQYSVDQDFCWSLWAGSAAAPWSLLQSCLGNASDALTLNEFTHELI